MQMGVCSWLCWLHSDSLAMVAWAAAQGLLLDWHLIHSPTQNHPEPGPFPELNSGC